MVHDENMLIMNLEKTESIINQKIKKFTNY